MFLDLDDQFHSIIIKESFSTAKLTRHFTAIIRPVRASITRIYLSLQVVAKSDPL